MQGSHRAPVGPHFSMTAFGQPYLHRIWPIHWSEVGQLCLAKLCEGDVPKREEPKISRLFFLLPLQISCFSLSTMPKRDQTRILSGFRFTAIPRGDGTMKFHTHTHTHTYTHIQTDTHTQTTTTSNRRTGCWCAWAPFFLTLRRGMPSTRSFGARGGVSPTNPPSHFFPCDRPLSKHSQRTLSHFAWGSPARNVCSGHLGELRTLVPPAGPPLTPPVMDFRGLLGIPRTVQFHQNLHTVESRVQHLHITARPIRA